MLDSMCKRGWAALGWALLVLATGAWETPIARARRLAREYMPATLHQTPTGREKPRPVLPVRVRVYADTECRAGQFDPRAKFRRLLDRANAFATPGFGVRFDLVDFRRWEHPEGASRIENLGARLKELYARDDGRDVDLVVGCTAPISIEADSFETIGVAYTFSKHAVLRPLSEAVEEKDFNEAFWLLDQSERAQLLRSRREHKEVTVFLHEWAHALGAPHERELGWILHPTWNTKQGAFSYANTAIMEIAIRHRLGDTYDPKAEAAELLAFVKTAGYGEWSDRDRSHLIETLEQRARGEDTRATAGESSTAPGGLSPEDVDLYNRAVGLFNEGKRGEAWTVLAPLAERRNDAALVQRLACRCGRHAPDPEAVAARCERALSLAGSDPAPFVEAAETYLDLKREDAALVALSGAVQRTGETTTPDLWARIVDLELFLGALSTGEEHVPRAKDAIKANAAVAFTRARRRIGLPAGDNRGLDRALEPAYVRTFWELAELLRNGKLIDVDKRLTRGGLYAKIPGWRALECELAARRGQAPRAERACAAALAGYDETVRALLMQGHLRVNTGRVAAGIKDLERALDLDPDDRAVWATLASAYTRAGRKDRLQSLSERHAKAFGEPLRP